MDDREFIERLHRKDTAAIRHLSETLLPSVWRFVYFRVKGDRHLAEDIVSETVLALIKAVAVSDADVLSPSAWLRSVANHKIQDHYRAVARVQHLIDQAAAVAGQNESVQPACEAEEQRVAVRKVMDELPEPQRLALEWKYVDHMSVQEIAVRMALTDKAVESILYRARREFRAGLGMLHRDDVPFRLDGTSKPTSESGKVKNHGRSPVNGNVPIQPSTDVIANHPAGLEEQKQRQS